MALLLLVLAEETHQYKPAADQTQAPVARGNRFSEIASGDRSAAVAALLATVVADPSASGSVAVIVGED